MQLEADAQSFMYQHSHAALATVDAGLHPLSTAVNTVPDQEGRLIVLLSDLAEHTANIRQNADENYNAHIQYQVDQYPECELTP